MFSEKRTGEHNSKRSKDLSRSEIKVVVLKEKYLSERVAGFVSIDKLCFPSDRRWSRENFMKELPEKWSFSRVAFSKALKGEFEPIGYVIASRYGAKKVHMHKLAVHPSFQRLGIGTKLVRSLILEAFQNGFVEVTAESVDRDTRANSFYEAVGFERLHGKEIAQYLSERNKASLAGKKKGRLYSVRTGMSPPTGRLLGRRKCS